MALWVISWNRRLMEGRVLGLEASLLKEDRACIFKRLWSPGIDSKEWTSLAYVAWRAGTITPFPTRFLAPIYCLKIPAQVGSGDTLWIP